MPQAIPITIEREVSDATPLVFDPIDAEPGQSYFEASDGSIPAGNASLILSYSRPNNGRRTYKLGTKYTQPLERTDVNSVTTATNKALVDLKYTIPEVMTDAEREHFAYAVARIVEQTIIKGYVTDLRPVY